jgi:hypothetical protein
MDYIEIIDKCLKYSHNFDPSHFIYFFFGKTEITKYDMYIIEKIQLLRQDFKSFWLSLDEKNKMKFISMITDDVDKDTFYPQIKLPKNIILF